MGIKRKNSVAAAQRVAAEPLVTLTGLQALLLKTCPTRVLSPPFWTMETHFLMEEHLFLINETWERCASGWRPQVDHPGCRPSS